jgi:hypothetical protein
MFLLEKKLTLNQVQGDFGETNRRKTEGVTQRRSS